MSLFYALVPALFLMTQNVVFAADAAPKKTPWPIGEKHAIEVTWLGITSLTLHLEVMGAETVTHDVSKTPLETIRIKGNAKNSWLVGVFYKLDDTVETWMDLKTMASAQMHVVQKEANQNVDLWEYFSPSTGHARFTQDFQRPREAVVKTGEKSTIPKNSQDTLSALFWLRTQKMKPGERKIVNVISQGKPMGVRVTAIRVEPYAFEKETFDATVYKLEKLDLNGNPGKSENLVWLANDDTARLLRFDVKTRFGHIIGKLENYELPAQKEPAKEPAKEVSKAAP